MFEYQMYRSPYAMAIAAGVGGADRARAAAAQQTGQIDAQAAGTIGQAASGTLHDFLTYQMTQPKRDVEKAQAGILKSELAGRQRDDADNQALRDAMQASGGDPDAALQTLQQRGAIGAATKLRTQLTEERLKSIDEHAKLLKLSQDSLGTASQMLQGVPDAADPVGAYQTVLPKVRALIGPDLAKALPDDYDADRVGQAITWGETAQQLLDRRRAALETARDGVATAKDAREKDAYFTKALAQWLPTVKTQDDWTQALGAVTKLGATPSTLAKFGATYTPEAATRAATFGVDASKAPVPGTFEDYIVTAARDAGKPPAALTAKDKEGLAQRWAQAHKIDSPGELTDAKRADLVQTILQYPSVYQDLTDTTKSAIAGDLNKAGFTGFARQATAATLAAAERWRQEQLTALDKRFKEAQALPELHGAMTADDVAAEQAAINASYRAQIGGASVPPKPAAAPPPAVKPAGGAQTPPAAATPGGVPPSVATTLQGQKPGKYTLSDGSKWILGKDGSIQPGS